MSYLGEDQLRALLGKLSLRDKAGLLTGAGFWTLSPLPRIGLRALVMSDGPNGVRGNGWDERDTSLLLPVASALGATWDRAAARRAGEIFGDEARRRGVHVVLAPTVNVHRSPFGGRHFENFSEDPRLIAELGAEVVAGIQSRRVAATPKHYVANDTETGRVTYDVRVDERTLREVYLRPFEYIVDAAAPWVVMAAYNSVNGSTMTEHSLLINDVLKGEWGFDGVVVSDWYAARDLEGAARGGLDLVMPGPGGPWSKDALADAVSDGRVAESVLDDKVLRVLRLAGRTGALGDEADPVETTREQTRPVIRQLATEGFVLLRNETADAAPLLPLDAGAVRKVAVIGENALLPAVQGGGSSHVNPPHVVTPLDGIRAALPDAQVTYQRGVRQRRLLETVSLDDVTDPEGEGHGFRVDFLDEAGEVVSTELRGTDRLLWTGRQALPNRTARIRLRGRLLVGEAGMHTFAVNGAGRYRVEVAGREVFDGDVTSGAVAEDPIENLIAPPEHRVNVVLVDTDLDAEGNVSLAVECTPESLEDLVSLGVGHVSNGGDIESEWVHAVDAAGRAEVAIVVVGTNDEVETEGRDRESLDLPGQQDELVRAVVAANPRTVVVVNAGAPVLMPWVNEVPALLWTWFGSQEYGDALADVLFGSSEPGGRLPTTFPAELADVPVSLPAVQPVDGRLEYSEGTLIGHRAYAASGTTPLFHFGHGFGYTTWEYRDVAAESAEGGVRLRVILRNAGERQGREVVQVYDRGPDGEPPRLVGFTAVHAEAGAEATAVIDVEPRALARYGEHGWAVPPGEHDFLIGHSAGDIRLTLSRTL